MSDQEESTAEELPEKEIENIEKENIEKEETGSNKTEENLRISANGICSPDFLEESFEKKEQVEKDRKEAEYHNCIFIDGKELNSFIFNSGEINGGITQSSYGGGEEKKEENTFREKHDLTGFLASHQKDGYASVLIIMAVLKAVPEQYLFSFSEELQKILTPEENEKEEKIPVAYQSVDSIINVISAERIEIVVNTAVGKIPVRSLVLKDKSQIGSIMKAIWYDYPGMREGLIKWLILLSRKQDVRKILLCQLAEAVGTFAAYDFTYAQNKIIPRFSQLKGRDDFYFLNKVMEHCLGSDSCGRFADRLLEQWCFTKELWKIPLHLYHSQESREFHRSLAKKLRNIIEEELDDAREIEGRDYIYIFTDFSKIPFDLLQENQDGAGLYMKTLSEVFAECKSRKERMRFGYYFCGLLLQDFLTEGYPFYKCAILDSFHKKELRSGISPVMTYVWQVKALRDIIANEILSRYIQELDYYSRSWEYGKSFLKSLAFTGQQEDYKNAIRMLERRGTKGKTADEMRDYLENLLQQRKKGDR